ncbi:MAG: DNA-directed RNA polymerase subunit beta' [Spirochaetae bacterium HGW-Spirochaetae-5]|nr:MAG: DNA-directed RNA polymerase subunit beta' [Spirochaetae bacterium HGW-Spirochaetae-5]
MRDFNDFSSIQIKLASPDMIREWSYGEVKKPETINYRTLKPERDGLFCEKTFGTTKEWECYCGKFKSIRYKGVVCDRCGVEVTHYKVRRERGGHIELAAPVAHIWYYRSVPSRMGLILDLTVSNLKSVLYYEKYIVIEPGDAEADDIKRGDILDEEIYYDLYDKYGENFIASMGAEAIKELLVSIDLDEESRALRADIDAKAAKDAKIDKKIIKRLEIIESFKESGNKPEWMILDVVPVIPPELRPMVQLDGGRFATSDLNDLYRRVINRNNRLKRLLTLRAPEIIVRNEKRMLQEAVDALFDNSRRKRAVKGKGNRPLKSLSDMLKGKQGRFRQNLLGKRVDYSGRSVIVVGPELKLHQCGLPKKMAIELFKPFIMKRLVDKDFVQNIKSAKKMVENERDEVWEVLDEVIREHPVLLNRAPTLHRLGIQAFEPVLVEGKAIKLHPLVCHAYNADFDGDQMAVHVPLSPKAQLECWTLMMSTNNLLSPANGHPVVTPSQDIVLGIYYLTDLIEGSIGEDKYFDDMIDVLRAVDQKQIRYRTRINYLMGEEFVKTTAGRLIFNGILPKGYPFVNNVITDKGLSAIIARTFKDFGPNETVRMLDEVKETGYRYATFFAPTISVSDILIPAAKKQIIEEEDKKVEVIENEYRNGFITDEERYNRVINLWTEANEKIANVMFEELEQDMDGHNSIFIMAKSGARGSKQQIRQLAGMRGLMAKPSGEIIEVPIRSNFKEGLTVLEYFISTNGARKGLADTALKTADAGYLTRRLVDIAQDVVINHDDCGTTVGIDIYPIKEGDMVIESLGARVLGRTLLYDLINPVTGEILSKSDEVINEDIADIIDEIEIDSIEIRSVLTCESKHGVCAKCYGRNLASSRPVEIGEAVGIIAAQSIGQPGTQLTMRTFHIGGIASRSVEESEIKFSYPIFINNITSKMIKTEEEKIITVRRGYVVVQRIISEVEFKPKSEFLLEDGEKVYAGKVFAKSPAGEEYRATNTGMLKIDKKKAYIIGEPYSIPVNVGTEIVAELEFDKKSGIFEPVMKPYQANEIIAAFDPWFESILTEITGRVEYVDVELNKSLIEEIDPVTNNKKRVIVEYKTEKLQPRVNIYGSGTEPTTYLLPKGANLMVETGDVVNAGVILAKIPRSAEKTKDITGGLPRVAELFEARTPRDAATLTAIDGTVTIGDTSKNKRKIIITAEDGSQKEYSIPVSKFLRVQDKDWLAKGEKIDDGPVDPHEILKIKGPRELQKFLVNEILEVYRLQGVAINDKHIEVIVRQMLRKVRVTDQGDSNFVIEQVVDKFDFIEENDRVLREGGKASTAIPVLMGITKAALNTESFISAASFQETTRVLTDAAIKGKVDHLRGLKENVIIGHLIPAGTGVRIYDNMDVYQQIPGDLDGNVQEAVAVEAEELHSAPVPEVLDFENIEK